MACSVLVGFSFTALVELDIDEVTAANLQTAGYDWMEEIYYISVSCTMAFSLYVIVVSSIAVMQGQRMALHGNVDTEAINRELPSMLGGRDGMIEQRCNSPDMLSAGFGAEPEKVVSDDVQQALKAMRAVQPSLIFSFGIALFSFIIAAVAMAWIKTVALHLQSGNSMNHMALVLSFVFVALLLAIGGVTLWMGKLFKVRRYHTGNLTPTSPFLSHLRQPLAMPSAFDDRSHY
ncbi:MAG: hypothetical protein SGPRY_003970 [Prymnesium sp.]